MFHKKTEERVKMKKNIMHILIVILIISQVASILKINNLQRQIKSTNIEMNNLSNRIRSDLDFDGEMFLTEKNGTTFAATVSRSIFGDALPKIVIDENGVKKTMQDDQIGIWSIKERVFPIMIPRLIGEARFDGKIYRRKGNLSADIKEVPSGIEFKEIC
jgi:hypothetical protein